MSGVPIEGTAHSSELASAIGGSLFIDAGVEEVLDSNSTKYFEENNNFDFDPLDGVQLGDTGLTTSERLSSSWVAEGLRSQVKNNSIQGSVVYAFCPTGPTPTTEQAGGSFCTPLPS